MTIEIKPGDKVRVNRSGDLFMEAEARPFIEQVVEVVKITKGGLYQIRLPDGRVYSLPKRNLDLLL